MGTIHGRVAIVTGASGGIGKAICGALAAEGADVVAQYFHNQAEVENAAVAVRAAGRQVEVVRADISVAAEARALVGRAVERFGRLDILVNSAGVFPRSWALEIAEEEWDRVMAVNLKGTFLCCQAAAPVLKRGGGGRIVNFSSIAVRGAPQGAHYSASKAAIVGLTRSLALEWAPDVVVNAVAPGITDTPMPRAVMDDRQFAERALQIPLRRVGHPDDMARAVLYLASEASTWMTGQVIQVNGGEVML